MSDEGRRHPGDSDIRWAQDPAGNWHPIVPADPAAAPRQLATQPQQSRLKPFLLLAGIVLLVIGIYVFNQGTGEKGIGETVTPTCVDAVGDSGCEVAAGKDKMTAGGVVMAVGGITIVGALFVRSRTS